MANSDQFICINPKDKEVGKFLILTCIDRWTSQLNLRHQNAKGLKMIMTDRYPVVW